MGNRGTVVFASDDKLSDVGYYLHWNGGPESVYAFLAELDRRGVDDNRFYQVAGEFFDYSGMTVERHGLSLYAYGVTNTVLEPASLLELSADLGDNGIYVIDRRRGTVRRFHVDWHYDSDDKYDAEAVELEPNKVADEIRHAGQHPYAAALAEFYRDLDRRLDVGATMSAYGAGDTTREPRRRPYDYRPVWDVTSIRQAQEAIGAIGAPY